MSVWLHQRPAGHEKQASSSLRKLHSTPGRWLQTSEGTDTCLAALAGAERHIGRAGALASPTVCVLVRAIVPVALTATLSLAPWSRSVGLQ